MSIEAGRLVLRHHQNTPQSAIDTIRKRKINDPIIRAKGDSWFCPFPGQWVQASPLAPRENQCQYAIHLSLTAGFFTIIVVSGHQSTFCCGRTHSSLFHSRPHKIWRIRLSVILAVNNDLETRNFRNPCRISKLFKCASQIEVRIKLTYPAWTFAESLSGTLTSQTRHSSHSKSNPVHHNGEE